MPEITKTYKVTSIKQLIDLNQDSTNFKLKFTCQSKDPAAKFNIIVVNQSQLDDPNMQDLDFKDAQGFISGDILADKNIYQNYFLIMKADKECDVQVAINKEEIPPKATAPQPPLKTSSPVGKGITSGDKKKSFLTSNVFLWIVVGIVAMVLLYFIFFSSEKKTTAAPEMIKNLAFNTPPPTPSPSPMPSPSPLPSPSPMPIKTKRKKKKKKYSFNDFHM